MRRGTAMVPSEPSAAAPRPRETDVGQGETSDHLSSMRCPRPCWRSWPRRAPVVCSFRAGAESPAHPTDQAACRSMYSRRAAARRAPQHSQRAAPRRVAILGLATPRPPAPPSPSSGWTTPTPARTWLTPPQKTTARSRPSPPAPNRHHQATTANRGLLVPSQIRCSAAPTRGNRSTRLSSESGRVGISRHGSFPDRGDPELAGRRVARAGLVAR